MDADAEEGSAPEKDRGGGNTSGYLRKPGSGAEPFPGFLHFGILMIRPGAIFPPHPSASLTPSPPGGRLLVWEPFGQCERRTWIFLFLP